MTRYAGLDVSDRLTHICIVDGDGAIAWRGACATDPEVLAKTLRRYAPDVERVVLETGSLSAFLYHGLIEQDVPAVCICARNYGDSLLNAPNSGAKNPVLQASTMPCSAPAALRPRLFAIVRSLSPNPQTPANFTKMAPASMKFVKLGAVTCVRFRNSGELLSLTS